MQSSGARGVIVDRLGVDVSQPGTVRLSIWLVRLTTGGFLCGYCTPLKPAHCAAQSGQRECKRVSGIHREVCEGSPNIAAGERLERAADWVRRGHRITETIG